MPPLTVLALWLVSRQIKKLEESKVDCARSAGERL
jgi:hypothetical protein